MTETTTRTVTRQTCFRILGWGLGLIGLAAGLALSLKRSFTSWTLSPESADTYTSTQTDVTVLGAGLLAAGLISLVVMCAVELLLAHRDG